MIFEGQQFARAWLATAVAAGEDTERPSLYRSTLVEIFNEQGALLLSIDGVMFVRSWVPSADAGQWEPAPDLDDAPSSEIVLSDKFGRAKGLCAHIAKVTKGDDPIDPEASVSLDVATAAVGGQLPGMETRWATLSYPGEESVKLHVPEGNWPRWRDLVANHRLNHTREWTMSPDLLGRLGRLGARIPGCEIHFEFGGSNKAALFTARNEDLEIFGLVMPLGVPDEEELAPLLAVAEPAGV